MRRSAEIRDTLLRFYEAFSAPDLERFAQVIAQKGEGILVIGTATLVTGQKVESGG